jgi:hypothetical protein
MSSTPAEKSPTQGQNANTVGKFYSLTPAKFASPAEYKKAKDKAYDEWRDSLKTSDDYNNAARDLLSQQKAGDRYQQYNVRDGLATIQNDAQANGVKLAPDVEQGLGEYSLGELGRIGSAFGEGYAGRGRGLQRRPGEGKGKGDGKAEQQKKDDNVQVRARKKQQGMALVDKSNFHPKTDPMKRNPALWSGGDAAKNHASSLGYGTIANTQGGGALEGFLKQNPDLKWEDSKQLWKRASQKYAKGVTNHYGEGGTAPAVVNGSPNPDSIYRTDEAPIVRGGGVTINEIPVP